VARSPWRPSALFLGLVALTAATGAMLWTGYGNPRLAAFGFVVGGWLVSLCLHEFAHAVVAYRAGDTTVAERGYLTLNPLRYSHPLLSIVLPVVVVLLGGIGLPGGAVWVNRHAIPGRLRHSLVSAAGPATNVLFTLALAAPFALGAADASAGADGGFDGGGRADFYNALALLAFLQLTASLLNLLPVPGLDGGNVVEPWLSPQWQRGYAMLAPYGFLVLFGLLWSDPIGGWFFAGVFALSDLIGLPSGRYAAGLDLIRFWTTG
jgi:Zn-dependent protease